MKEIKKYTVEEWKKLFNIQELLCKKYDIILIDYKTKREQIVGILDKISLKNINKGIETFNKIIQNFGGSMEQITTELNESSKNNIKIWSDSPKNEPKFHKTQDQINLEKIWGKRD